MPLSPKVILRLRKGSRYVIAVRLTDGKLHTAPFWSEPQAAAACGLTVDRWSSLQTEVFAEIYMDGFPVDVSVFAKSTRRGRIEAVVLWTKDGIYPEVLDRISDAAALILKSTPSNEGCLWIETAA